MSSFQLPLKSVQVAFERYFNLQKPLKSKWQVTTYFDKRDGKTYLCFYHYQHLLLMYDFKQQRVCYTWWEKPTDKRGLDSALMIIKEYERRKAEENHE